MNPFLKFSLNASHITTKHDAIVFAFYQISSLRTKLAIYFA